MKRPIRLMATLVSFGSPPTWYERVDSRWRLVDHAVGEMIEVVADAPGHCALMTSPLALFRSPYT